MFAFDCFTMPSATAGLPLKPTSLRSSSAPTSVRPTSRSRTGPESVSARIRSSYSSGVFISPGVRTVNSRLLPSMRPDGMSTFSRRSAAATSAIVSAWPVSRVLSIQIRIA